MGVFRQNLKIIEARQLSGDATATMDVIDWIRNRGGYPWLLGNLNEPETLVPAGSDEVGGEGVYIEPATGDLILHTHEKDVRASYGYWVVCDEQNKFEMMDDIDFKANYDPA